MVRPLHFSDLSSGLQKVLRWRKDDSTLYETAYVNKHMEPFIFDSANKLVKIYLDPSEFHRYVDKQEKRQF